MFTVRIVGKDGDGKPIKQIILNENYINNDERYPVIISNNGNVVIDGTDDQIKVLISDIYHQKEDE
jgi:hypothetical protein